MQDLRNLQSLAFLILPVDRNKAFGSQVGVAIMVGSMFMAMVGAEMLYDHLCDKVRAIFKQEKLAPDIERLHPAELVGTFSRYK